MNYIDLETGRLVLKSYGYYYDKEIKDIGVPESKRNTYRERCKLPKGYRDVKEIEIHCLECPEAFFTRKLTDISEFGNLVIFSW
jgi:hypothetical protein